MDGSFCELSGFQRGDAVKKNTDRSSRRLKCYGVVAVFASFALVKKDCYLFSTSDKKEQLCCSVESANEQQVHFLLFFLVLSRNDDFRCKREKRRKYDFFMESVW